MAQAILMGKDGGGSGKGIKVLEASTSNVIDFNTLTESGVYLIKNCDKNTTLNGKFDTYINQLINCILFVSNILATDGTCVEIHQHMFFSNTKTAFQRRYIASTNSWATFEYKITADYIKGGDLGGILVANGTAEATLTSKQVRNIQASTTDLTAGSSTLATGEIYFVYE